MQLDRGERIDWDVVNRKRLEAAEEERLRAIGELKAQVALLNDLSRLPAWKTLTSLLENTANAYQQTAMKAADPTTLARAFGYMAAMRDVIALPSSMAVQLESQLSNLAS